MNWIAIKDRVPTKEECEKYHGWFLVYAPFRARPDMSRYDGYDPEHSYEHGWKYNWDSEITHFAILPDLPKD